MKVSIKKPTKNKDRYRASKSIREGKQYGAASVQHHLLGHIEQQGGAYEGCILTQHGLA